jgi:hypothetical protein
MKQKHPRNPAGLVPADEPLLKTREVCTLYRVNQQWIYKHHDLPKMYVGGQLRFSARALKEFFVKKGLI